MKTISLIRKVVILTLTGLGAQSLEAACNAGWIGGVDETWTNGANWNPTCVPSASGDSAAFNMSSNNLTPTLSGGGETLSTLYFNTGAVSYTLMGGPLTFAGTGDSIQLLAGSHTIETNIIAANLTLNLIANALNYTGASFNATGVVTFTGTTGQFITNSNFTPATVNLNGGVLNAPNGFGPPLNFTLNGGTYYGGLNGGGVTNLVINSGLYLGSGATQQTVDINSFTLNGGTFQLNQVPYLITTPLTNSLTITGGYFTVFGPAPITFNDAMMASNAITISGGAVLLNQAILATNGSFSVTGGTTSLVNGGLAGAGVLQQGGGTIHADGGSGLQFNNINVSAGTLVNDGSALGIVNLTGGTIQGLGLFGDSITNTSGLVEPGDGVPGPLTIASSYTQAPAGILKIDFLNTGQFGSLQVQSASLSGVLELSGLPGFGASPSSVFPIIVADPGTVSGTFSQIKMINFPSSLMPMVTYTTDEVLVTMVQTVPAFVSIKELAISNINQINFLLFNRLDRLVNPCCCCPSWDWFVGPLGSVGSVHSKKRAVGYDFYTAGAIGGIDYTSKCFGVGGALDYQRLHGSGHHRFGSFDLDQLHGSLYGTMQLLNRLYIDLIMGGGYQWDSISRTTGFTQDLQAKSSPNGRLFDVLGGLEFQWSCKKVNATPFILVQYIYYHLDSFREHNADLFDLNFKKQKYESTRTMVGVRVDGDYRFYGFDFKPALNVAWQRELNETPHTLFFVNRSEGFIPSGLDIPECAEDTLLAGVDLQMRINSCYSLELSYEYEGSNRISDHFFYLGLTSRF